MHVISYAALKAFAVQHPTAKASLDSWYKIVEKTDFANLNELRKFFPHADVVKHANGNTLTVFNIHGNETRLITAIHYNSKKIYIRNVLTHAEYDKQRWKH